MLQVTAGEWLSGSTVTVQQICCSCVIVYIVNARFTSRYECVNNCDECGTALIQQLNAATKDKYRSWRNTANHYNLQSAICMNFALCRE